MKIPISLGLAALISANILFTHVPLHCSPDNPQIYFGCLRGQQCLKNGTCATASDIFPPCNESSSLYIRQANAALSMDGTCGRTNGGKVCNPKSTVYTGSCCSENGWCGNTAGHCGAGCQSGCSSSLTAPRADGYCGNAFGGAICDPDGPYGICCSQYGSCGVTDGHCLLANGCQTGCKSISGTTTPPRADGQCGIAFNNAACDPAGPFGGCCSKYGFCGSTSAHCLTANGCQLGCTNTVSTEKVTTDGACGSSNGGTVCGGWANGNCCSMYGYCGSSSAHCGAGCQSGKCISAPSVIPPSPSPAPVAANGGSFKVVGQAGVPAMHAALLPNGRVVFLDKIENYTQLVLPNGQYAYSSEYNPYDNTCVPLSYKSNAFCSGGIFLQDGRVVSLGGNAPLTWLDPTVEDGFNAIRYLTRSSTDASLNGQSWSEPGNKLASDRWYATAQIMPDARIFVASGSLNGLNPAVFSNNNPTYEMLSATGVTEGTNIMLAILQKNQPYYMYPFVHLLKDGTLFIFVSKSSERFSLAINAPMQTYPDLPGDYRTYPNTGGSVLLPFCSANNWNPDIIICGGGAYQDITSPTDPSCGRINPLSINPTWEMDSMPEGRGMVEGILLPDGTILWLNGGSQGAQGFGLCTKPALEALLYTPGRPLGQRWSTMAASTIPRLYHSIALLLLDGTVLIAGSNPVQMPVLVADVNNPYPTEFRVEIFIPPYLQGSNGNRRPTDVVLSTLTLIPDGSTFSITFISPTGAQVCSAVLYHGGFVTHSLHMGHRMLQLDSTGWNAGTRTQTLTVTTPPNHNVCPPGPYVVYMICDGVPAMGQFVSVR